jgi:hypothetical protein
MGGAGDGGSGRVQVVDSKGCSRLFVGMSASLPSFRGLQSLEPMSPVTSSIGSEPVVVRSHGPFAGLVICVTGLSKGIYFVVLSNIFCLFLIFKMLNC